MVKNGAKNGTQSEFFNNRQDENQKKLKNLGEKGRCLITFMFFSESLKDGEVAYLLKRKESTVLYSGQLMQCTSNYTSAIAPVRNKILLFNH